MTLVGEEERVRKLALLPRWEKLLNQYDALLLQQHIKELKAEREDLWLQFPEESLLRMIGEIERKIRDFSVQSKKDGQKTEGPDNLQPTTGEPRETKKQNTERIWSLLYQ
jgi:hypothetical protein